MKTALFVDFDNVYSGLRKLDYSIAERFDHDVGVALEHRHETLQRFDQIDGVEKDVADNIRSYLTLTRYVTREDLTDGQVRRLADKAVDEAADAMRPFGYYSPTIRSRTSRDEPNWIVRLKIQPGDPVRLTTVDLKLAGAGSDDEGAGPGRP